MICYVNVIGIDVLMFYVFLIENWKRFIDEVDFLMKFFVEFFDFFVLELIEENVCVNVMGYRENLFNYMMCVVEKVIVDIVYCIGFMFNFVFNYGGCLEIIIVVKEVMKELEFEGKSVDDLIEEKLNDYLMSSGLGDFDLLIWMSGEFRLSNFMFW